MDWNIDWDSWSLYLSNVLSKGWDKVVPQKKKMEEPIPLTEAPEKRKGVTAKDLKFIDDYPSQKKRNLASIMLRSMI